VISTGGIDPALSLPGSPDTGDTSKDRAIQLTGLDQFSVSRSSPAKCSIRLRISHRARLVELRSLVLNFTDPVGP
jgi:hypothetical protein